MQLFRPKTIEQFQIQRFLADEGLQPDAIQEVSFPDRYSVKIIDPPGSQMVVRKAAPGVYEFTYLIRGVKSFETRYDPSEAPERDKEEAAAE